MKSFGIEASNAMSIVDKFNEVGNNFSISSAGIGEALLRSASSLAAAGNDIDESIAMITAMNTTLQNPEKVGTALKTISARLRNTAGALQELEIDSDGAVESVTKLQTQLLNLTNGKVDIMLDSETFKSTYQILKELSAEWDNLTDKSRADITRLIAGNNQNNALSSLMINFSQTQDIIDASVGSFNSAMKENERVLDSINGKISQFTAAFQQLSNTVISSDFIKGIVDSGKTFIEILNTIIEKVGTLPTLFAAIGAAMSFKDVGEPKMEGSFQGMNTPTNILSVRTLSELPA